MQPITKALSDSPSHLPGESRLPVASVRPTEASAMPAAEPCRHLARISEMRAADQELPARRDLLHLARDWDSAIEAARRELTPFDQPIHRLGLGPDRPRPAPQLRIGAGFSPKS